jgi:phosphoglycolate phosphatase
MHTAQPALVFDLDGTLSDPALGITRSFNYALTRFGLPEKDPGSLLKYIGPKLDTSFAELLNDPGPADITDAVRFFRERYGEVGYRENVLYEGAIEVLEGLLENGHRLHVATTKRTDVALRVLEFFGIRQLFDMVLGGGLSRTKSELLQQINAEEERDLVMVGDRSFDMIAGREVGARCIGALWGFGSDLELRESGADILCPEIRVLPTLL